MGRVRGVLDALSSARAPVAAAAPVGLLAALAPQDAEAGPVSVVDDVTGAVKRVIEAWHGSPHKFDRFDMSKIGTGEGAQAYGYGLYAADSQDVARGYRGELTGRDAQARFQSALPDDADFGDVLDLLDAGEFTESQAKVVRALANDDWLGFDYPSQAINAAYRDLDRYDPSPELRAALADEGALYRLHINADPDTLLDWDKPLSEQSEAVQDALRAAGHDFIPYKTGQDIVHSVPGANRAEQSAYLRGIGIPGIRYLDGMSRGAGEGSYNYVVFDDALIDIKERGAANPQLLAGVGGGGLLAALSNKVGQGVDFATNSMEMPTRGLHGLAQTVGTLATGGGWENAIRNGAQYSRQPLDVTARNVGEYTADKTGNPYLASLMDALTRMASLEP